MTAFAVPSPGAPTPTATATVAPAPPLHVRIDDLPSSGWGGLLNVVIAVATLVAAGVAVFSARAAQKTSKDGLQQARALAESDREAARELAREDRQAAIALAAEERRLQHERDRLEWQYERELEGRRLEINNVRATVDAVFTTFYLQGINMGANEIGAARGKLQAQLAGFGDGWPAARYVAVGLIQLPPDLAELHDRQYGERPASMEQALLQEADFYITEAEEKLFRLNLPGDRGAAQV